MTQTFKVGDKVVNDVFGAGEIVYGPYDGETYLYKTEDGDHRTVAGSLCKPAPKFKVGDMVKGRMTGRDIKILAGPFRRGNGAEWYATELPGGAQIAEDAGNLVAQAPADTYEYNGVTYDFTARYLDRDGDYWTFKDVDGTVRGECSTYRTSNVTVYDDSDTLESAVRNYGPLTRV